MTEYNTIYLSLGSNLGDRMENLQYALQKLEKTIGKIVIVSSVYESESWGYDSTNNYLNCCLCLSTSLSPIQLLNTTQDIEREMGRIKTTEYTDRIIDIDILFYNNLLLNEETLVLPHPHIHNRDFVLLPLNEIAPDLILNKHFLTIHQIMNNRSNSTFPVHYGSLTFN